MSPAGIVAGMDSGRLARIDRHFARYVDDGRLAGWQVLVARHGELVHSSVHGVRDLASGAPFTDDTIVRLYSMTKPITSVAAMMLVEEGVIQLKDPVSAYIPEFAATRVYRSGSIQKPMTEPQTEPMLVWHLLTHMSGLTYGFHNTHAVDAMYRAAGFEWGYPDGVDLAEICRRWAALPLVFQPGTEWNYGVSTDVLGRVVEVASGMDLESFFRTRILDPLGMHDTAFTLPDADLDRLATLYVAHPATGEAIPAPSMLVPSTTPTMFSGGGGLYGTLDDYMAFVEMLRRGGSARDGRLHSPATLDFMMRNHLPGDIASMGPRSFAEQPMEGMGLKSSGCWPR